MKITRNHLLALAFLGASAHTSLAGIIAKFNSADIGYVGNTGSYVAEPPVWSHDPTVTVSKFTKHGSVTGGNDTEMMYEGWGTVPDPANYLGFTVTPTAGDTLVLTHLDFSYRDRGQGPVYRYGYRIDTGSGFGPWIYAETITAIGFSSKTWTFPAPITTTGTIEFGFFGAAPSVDIQSQPGSPVLYGTAGDTTPDPSLVGVISKYTRAASYRVDVGEASTLTYNWDTDTLFTLSDENSGIAEINKKGVRLSTMRTNQLNFPSTYKGDPEALAYLGIDEATGLGKFMIGAERENVSMILKYFPNGNDTPDWMRVPATIVWGPTNGNVGLEGISYDSRDGTYYGIKERQPTSLLHATNIGTPSQALSRIDLNDVKWRQEITDLSDLFVMANSEAYADSDHILLLARAQQKIIEITKAGKVVDVLNIAAFQQGTIEGITMDNDGVLYLCGEGGGTPDVSKNQSFHVLTPPKPLVSGTGGRQIITGTSAGEEISGNQAADILNGGDGPDTFVFKTLRDGVDTINGFTPGVDVLDLGAVLRSTGYLGSNTYTYLPLTDGTVRVVDSPSGAIVQLKSAGSYRSLIVLPGLTAAQAGVPGNFQFLSTTLGN